MRRLVPSLLAVLLLLSALPLTLAPAAAATAYSIDLMEVLEVVQGQPVCSGVGYTNHNDITRRDCGSLRAYLTPVTPDVPVLMELEGPDGTAFLTADAVTDTAGIARLTLTPDASWPAGVLTGRATVQGEDTGTGSMKILFNVLRTSVGSAEPSYLKGEDLVVTGTAETADTIGCCNTVTNPAAGGEVLVTLRDHEGNVLVADVPGTVDGTGRFAVTVPGSATEGLVIGPETGYALTLGADARVTYDDPSSGEWVGSGAGSVTVRSLPSSLLVDADFVSSTGWVKPGDTYPFRVTVTNATTDVHTGAVVSIPAAPGVTFLEATSLDDSGTVDVQSGAVTWTLPTVAATTDVAPTTHTMVVLARAATYDQDPRIAWKDLSSTATVSYDGYAGPTLSGTTHGPKVIPEGAQFETARYGDKPFPMVPVDYRDRKHSAAHTGAALDRAVNAPDLAGSTFNLFQEMSYGQLYPIGTVPSSSIASASFDYEPGFAFSEPEFERGTCRGTTMSLAPDLWGTDLYPSRIDDGWYQLPGDTEYYGGDYPAFALNVAGSIDSACGTISKSVYDAAHIADPEIDYNDYDSDKDGVVDFFMMVFVGLGGNGDSQINGLPPYDNIWPHSSSLEFYWKDAATGLRGYISDDQLKSLTEVPQCWMDDTYARYTDCAADGGAGDDSLPVYVRVGPYNVNPEEAIEKASVISHEYGHHLGLPDFYSSYASYGTQNLMAADHSQHMTIFGKQELGWVVPQYLEPGEVREVTDWNEIKNDTGEIHWQMPDGTPYTLSAANGDQNIHNGETYSLKLPKKLIIDPEKVATQASASHVWWSGRGNDFGCSPTAGHNIDLHLPELADVPAGTPVTLEFKSSWDIEWDWDYGFTMITTDGEDYTALPSQNGYTTDSSYNPNGAGCLDENNHGLTGQSGSYERGQAIVTAARAEGTYDDPSPFLVDSYDISALAGVDAGTVRFSYFTDPGFDRPGWFIDDVKVTAGDEVIYDSDLEWTNHGTGEHGRWFQGGCDQDGFNVSAICTVGWNRVNADAGASADHAYYLELRDRSGFDFDGHDMSDRGLVSWAAGVFLEYTDEVRGYGNNGSPQPPNQQYLDSQPVAGADCDGFTGPNPLGLPGALLGFDNCADNSFTAVEGDSLFEDDPADDNGPWIDNFQDPNSPSGNWEFGYNCLRLEVTSLTGQAENSAALPSDLRANARIEAGPGCIPPTYRGSEGGVSEAVTGVVARATAKTTTPAVGENVAFDASASENRSGSRDALSYGWDFGDGTQAQGQSVTHAYGAEGTYTVTLTVTNADGESDTDELQMVVSGSAGSPEPAPLPTTGGGLALAGLLVFGFAASLRRRALI